ncbi:hypothetical protein [Micromonospora echinofusca]|uniref:hypothetical protein n=1 Tax=Micromonospora echinofusca TaxID=47858 RepID=UPI001FCE0234|nr:hypothetical protein [Micromonospora echinofusca]
MARYLIFLPLLAVSRQDPGRCGLFQWLTTLDTSVWLRERGLAHLRADGYGVWLEDGRCVWSLVHVDPGPVGEVVAERERSTAGLGAVLAGYRRTDPVVPGGAVLVIAYDAARETNLLADLEPAVTGIGRGHRRRPPPPALAPRTDVEDSDHGHRTSPVDRPLISVRTTPE